jgi:hypothetical protein
MSIDEVLDTQTQTMLREKAVIQQNEVAIRSGDLYCARNVLTDERRIIATTLVEQTMQNRAITEQTKREILKG